MLLFLIDPLGISRGEDKVTSFPSDFKHVTGATAVDKEKTPPAENKEWNELHSASQGGGVDIIETMLSLGIDINSKDSLGTTPLMVAAASGKMQAVNFLLKKGADPFLRTNTGRNLLHAAVEGGNVLIVKTVLSNNIDINAKDDDGHTSLMKAAYQNNLEVVECLLRKGADPLLKDNLGRNVLLIASQYGSIAVIEQLLSVVDINSRDDEGNTPLMVAAACANVQAVNYLLEKDADLLLTGKSGWSLLHFASQGGNVAIIETILSKGLDIDIKDDCGTGLTPLAVSILFKNLEALNYLLNKGANPFVENNLNGNLLHLATKGGDVDIIKAILSHGFDINSRDDECNTPLMVAAACANVQAVNYLLEKDADLLLTGKGGLSSLHFASQGDNVAIIETILSKGLDIDIKDDCGTGLTPLAVAILFKNLEALNYLLNKGANPFVEWNHINGNSLHLATIGGDVDIIKAILSHGFDINIKTSEGLTPLMLATFTKKAAVVDCFLENGADPTLRDNSGRTCLHHASQRADVPIIKKCLSLGLDIESKDVDGKTPLMIAVAEGNSDAVEFLLKKKGGFQFKQGSAQ